jgi:hypothetical protein
VAFEERRFPNPKSIKSKITKADGRTGMIAIVHGYKDYHEEAMKAL